MRIKSTVLQVLAAACLGAGLLYAMGIEGGAQLGGTVEHYIFPRTPAVLFFRTAGQPVNRVVRGQPLCGTIFCYGWRGGDIKPLSGALLAELLDCLKDTEVRV